MFALAMRMVDVMLVKVTQVARCFAEVSTILRNGTWLVLLVTAMAVHVKVNSVHTHELRYTWTGLKWHQNIARNYSRV